MALCGGTWTSTRRWHVEPTSGQHAAQQQRQGISDLHAKSRGVAARIEGDARDMIAYVNENGIRAAERLGAQGVVSQTGD